MTDEYLRAMQELWTSPRAVVRRQVHAVQRPRLRAQARAEAAPADLGRRPQPGRAAPHRRVRRGVASRSTVRRTSCARAAPSWRGSVRPAAARSPPALTLRNDVRVAAPGPDARRPPRTRGRVMAGEPAALVDQIGELAELRRRAPRAGVPGRRRPRARRADDDLRRARAAAASA